MWTIILEGVALEIDGIVEILLDLRVGAGVKMEQFRGADVAPFISDGDCPREL